MEKEKGRGFYRPAKPSDVGPRVKLTVYRVGLLPLARSHTPLEDNARPVIRQAVPLWGGLTVPWLRLGQGAVMTIPPRARLPPQDSSVVPNSGCAGAIHPGPPVVRASAP